MPMTNKRERCRLCGTALDDPSVTLSRFPGVCEWCSRAAILHEGARRIEGWAVRLGRRRAAEVLLVRADQAVEATGFPQYHRSMMCEYHRVWLAAWEFGRCQKSLRKVIERLVPPGAVDCPVPDPDVGAKL